MPGLTAAPLQRYAPVVGLGDVLADDKDPVVGQQRHAVVAERIDRFRGVDRVVDRALVLVEDGELARVHRSGLVVHGRHASGVGPQRSPTRVVVNGDADVVARLVQLEVQGDGRRHGPRAVEHVAVEIDTHDV